MRVATHVYGRIFYTVPPPFNIVIVCGNNRGEHAFSKPSDPLAYEEGLFSDLFSAMSGKKRMGKTDWSTEEDEEEGRRTHASAAATGGTTSSAESHPTPRPPDLDLQQHHAKKHQSGSDDDDDDDDDVKISSKRTRDSAGSDAVEEEARLHGVSPEELVRMSRSERKRHREKKRRSDVNKGFDELMTLLLEIDPGVRAEAEERARRGQWKGQLGAHEDNLLSRVDLIGRTAEALRRLHRENEERKLIIASLTRGGAATAGVAAGTGAAAGLGSLGTAGLGLSAPLGSAAPHDEVSLCCS